MRYYFLTALNEIWYGYGRFIAGRSFFIAAKIFWPFNKKTARALCAASLRYGVISSALLFYKKIINQFPYSKDDSSKFIEIKEAAVRTIIIQWPDVREDGVSKGILLITFTKTFSFYLRNVDLVELNRYFHIVLEPSWSGYADPDIIGFVGRLESVLVQASEIEDRVLLNSFPQTFIPVSFGASDWVDSKLFEKKASAKLYDSIYIANTNPIKRVKRYLDAIKRMVRSGRTDYVGCLVCAAWGGAQDLINKMVDGYGLHENIVLKFSLDRSQVIECLNESKVNILLSYKEGSNRSLFESIFCDTPVICIRENVGVNKAYINEFTGLLIADMQLEDTLLWFKDNYKNFSPRSWAIENIDPRVTTSKLKSVIDQRQVSGAAKASLADVYVKTNNPEVSYFDYPMVNHQSYTEAVLQLFKVGAKDIQRDNKTVIDRIVHIRDLFIDDIKKNSLS